MRSNELRKKLTLLGIDNIQVLDVYCPDWSVAAILVHEKYVETIMDKFSKAKIELKSDYNHMDPIHIRDPKLQSLTIEEKLEQSKKIFNNNMMRALSGMRYTARYSVARCFFRDNLITLEQLQSILKGNTSNNNINNTIDNIINYLPLHTNILFITETWLLSPRRLNTDWEQQNTYGTKRLNSYTGQDGLSYIVHPGFPFPVIPIINNNPQHNKYTISCRIQNLIIHCFYLPPRVSDSLCMTIIQSFIDQYDDSEYDVIFCGDFNARMGILTGDYRTTNTTQTPRTNNRGNLMLPLIINNGLTLWNEKLCYGIPTYLTGTTNSTTNVKSSIIDFFLTTTTDKFLCPEMSIATDLSLGSDHKLVTFGFQYQFNQPTVTTEQQHPRKLWRIKKL
ncbi:hypothetical protein BDF21DRAFT_470962, partial [Thamnidium elegans]